MMLQLSGGFYIDLDLSKNGPQRVTSRITGRTMIVFNLCSYCPEPRTTPKIKRRGLCGMVWHHGIAGGRDVLLLEQHEGEQWVF